MLEYIGIHIRDKLVFDIGANKGHMSNQFLSYGAKVIAIEPQERFNDAFKNCVAILNICVSDHNGEVDFYECGRSTLSSCYNKWLQINKHPFTWKNTYKVKCRTLDSLIHRYGRPEFVKVDVEGYESAVLAGLSRPVRYISIEYNTSNIEDFKKCTEHLSRLRYEHFMFYDTYVYCGKKCCMVTHYYNVNRCIEHCNKYHSSGNLLCTLETDSKHG